MAFSSDTNTLKQLLAKHELSNIYEQLSAKGYSMDLLSECSANDVEELCSDLSLHLIDRLRFKRCLKTIGIPKSSTYTVITQKEQLIINEINNKILVLQNTLITSSNDNKNNSSNSKLINQNKELINCTLDSIITMINNKRKQLLIELNDNFKNKQDQNAQILNCYNELKQIKIKCQKLFIPNQKNINFDQRYQTISQFWSQWQNKYTNFQLIDKININVKDMFNIRQTINNSIQIGAEKINLMEHIKNNNNNISEIKLDLENENYEQKVSINGLNYDEKQIDAIQIDNNEPKSQHITDVINVFDETLIYQHRPIRAWRMDKEQNKWRGRGKGQLSVYFNKKLNLAKIIFCDEKHNKTRLLQYINGENKAEYGEENDTIKWTGNDYTMDVEDPLMSQWKLTFSDENDTPVVAATEFLNLFNKHIQFINQPKTGNTNNVSQVVPQLEFNWNNAPDFGNFNFSFGGNNNNFSFENANIIPEEKQIAKESSVPGVDSDDNGNFTLEPIINLSEQSVPTGHENETLIESIPFKVLYVFGRDVSNEQCWKQRARMSGINFYKCNVKNKIRIVIREQETNKLRLNHYIPYSDTIAKLTLKNEKIVSWNAKDATLDDDISFFSVKFDDSNNAKTFVEQFKDSMRINEENKAEVWGVVPPNYFQDAAHDEFWEKSVHETHANSSSKMEEKIRRRPEVQDLVAQQIMPEDDAEVIAELKIKIKEIAQTEEINENNMEQFSFSFGGNSNDNNNNNNNNDGFANISWADTNNSFGFSSANSDKSKKECPICYETMKNALKTKCNHMFCGKCIKDSLNENSNCPMCRKECFIKDLTDINNEIEPTFESFSDNKEINFGEYMTNIKNFVTSEVTEINETMENKSENISAITFEPIVNLPEINVSSGHENDKLLAEFEINKLYRWGKDVSGITCWKVRACNTKLIFYQNIKNGKIRLVCRENITNKLRLNQWIVPIQILNIEKKNEKQIAWSAFDITIEEEDIHENNNGFCMFAAKFMDCDTTEGFYKQMKAASANNEELNKINENENDINEIKINEFDENKNHTKLDEYEIEELFIWNKYKNDWEKRGLNVRKLELYQNGSNGEMIIIARDLNNNLQLNHAIPGTDVANIKQKNNNEIHWDACDKSLRFLIIDTFNVRFKDEQVAKKFMAYFKAGSLNNDSISP